MQKYCLVDVMTRIAKNFSQWYTPTKSAQNLISGFPSKRTNLSPFTKDFRGGEHSNEYSSISYGRCIGGLVKRKADKLGSIPSTPPPSSLTGSRHILQPGSNRGQPITPSFTQHETAPPPPCPSNV